MKQPDDYKLVSAGRWLQREAQELQTQADATDTSEMGGASSKAMTLVESKNLQEVGDWLVNEGGDKA
jgi:ABC-type protease/lipase transport system fused ATPase/permease subunit